MGDARQDLLDRVLVHVAQEGVSDLSLRQLAAAVGTSHRMLIYHFGSREGLLAAIAASVEAQQRAALARLSGKSHTAPALIRALWQQVSDPELRPFVRLFFEVFAAAVHGRPGTERFLEHLTQPWLDEGQRAAAGMGVDAPAADLRLGVAVVRGLLMDVLATDSHDEASAALERFIDMWSRAHPAG